MERTGAYAARPAARWLVERGHARRAEVAVAYAIGVARPLAVHVASFGTAASGLADADLAALVEATFDLRPAAIIHRMGLRRPIGRQVAAYGHMGRPDLDLPWERA